MTDRVVSRGSGTPVVVRLADHRSAGPYYATAMTFGAPAPAGSWARLDHTEIAIHTRGGAWLTTAHADGAPRTHRVGPGTVTLLRPSDRFRYSRIDPDGLAALYVSFPDSYWQTFAGFVGVNARTVAVPETLVVSVDVTDADVVRPFDLAIERLRDAPTILDLVQFWLGVIPAIFPDTGRGRSSRAEPPSWLTRSLEALRDEANLREGLPRLLELAHVSASYLAVNTRRYFDATPRSLVMEYRLQHAAALLTTTEDSVRSIALRCGFDNVTYFSTAFKRAYHVSPREYQWRFFGAAPAALR